VSAVRAFHTGLIAEAYRRLRLLNKMAAHIDVLRRPARDEHKLAAVEESCRHLKSLGALGPPWRTTYRDLARHLRRVRHHLRQIVDRRRVGG
jgi:hypothetical protein